jgi:basic amino acid/polyamine antiporter, APA family
MVGGMTQRTDRQAKEQVVVLSEVATPKSAIALGDALALIVGLVIGVGIFQTPSIVASNLGSNSAALLAWFLGGVMSLIGALCYGELATAYPHAGGNYHYFMRAFGSGVAFLFAWARMAVIQTGSIATVAFVFGDYASQLFRVGDYSPSIYAAFAVILLTSLNIVGIEQGKWTQNWLSIAKVLGLLLVILVGAIFVAPSLPPITAPATTQTNWGSAMVFVLFSFGGWNEAAYISAELRNVKRNMVRLLLWSIGIITAIYLLINFAYIHGLGLTAMAQSEAVAADLMRSAFGEPGALFISFLIAIATLGATNANIFTGARTNYALGQDFRLFSFLGHWKSRTNTPKNALLVQGAITLALILLGSFTRQGFTTMVDYTAPVFWFFFLLSGVSLFILRTKEPQTPRPFRVPFYPLTPILFCLICGYLLYSSLVYTGIGAAFGVAVVVAGIPLLWLSSRH